MLFLTIPTAHSHPELLSGIMKDSGLPPEQIILVATKPNLNLPPGCVVIEDLGQPNIHRWWNVGVEAAINLGATAVAVLNDDLKINSETLTKLHSELERTNATIASPTRPDWGPGHYRNNNIFPYTPVIWGCLWILNTQSELRPDPKYVWWYGDSDLDIRARKDYAGIVTADVYYEHYFPGKGTSNSPSLQRQTDIDSQTFEREHKTFLKESRSTKPRKLFLQTQLHEVQGANVKDFRTDFFEYVNSTGDPSRDRVVLVEQNPLARDPIRKMWNHWTNVVIHDGSVSLTELAAAVSDGAELELIWCDFTNLPINQFREKNLSPAEIRVSLNLNPDSEITNTFTQLNYNKNSGLIIEGNRTLSFVRDEQSHLPKPPSKLMLMRNAIFKKRGSR